MAVILVTKATPASAFSLPIKLSSARVEIVPPVINRSDSFF